MPLHWWLHNGLLGLSTSVTAKFKEIYQFDSHIRKGRFGLLILAMPEVRNG